MNNFFKNIVASPNIDELKTDLKKKETLIDKLKEKLKKVQEEKEFVTKSYEQLEKKSATLQKKKGNEGSEFKQNMQFYLNALQKVPDEIMQSMVQILLSKMEQHIGQKLDSSASQSFLDLDFNYKNIFAEHANKIYEATKQRIQFDTKKNEMVNMYQNMLASKDKQIEQLIDRYENNQKNMEKQFQNKMQGKIRQLSMIKEEKNVMLMENSENLNRMIVQIQDLKKEIGRLKSSQSQLKVQKDKIENKYSEICEMNNHLMNKNTQLEIDLKTVKAEKEIMIQQVIKQNSEVKESLKKQIAESQQLKKQRVASDHDIQRMLDQLKLCQQENDKILLESKALTASNEVNKTDRIKLQKKIQNARQKISLLSNLKEVSNGKSSIEASLLQFSEFFNNFAAQFSRKCQQNQKLEERQGQKPQFSSVYSNPVDSQLHEANNTSIAIQPKESQISEQEKKPQVSQQKQVKQLEQLRMKIENTQRLLEQSRNSHVKLQSEIINLRQQLQSSENSNNSSRNTNIKLQEEVAQLKQKILRLQSEKQMMIDQHDKKYQIVLQQISSKNQQLLKANQQNNSKAQEAHEKISLCERSNKKLSQQVAQLSSTLDISNIKISQYQVETTQIKSQLSIKNQRIKQLQTQIISLQQSSLILERQLERLNKQLQGSTKQLLNERELVKSAGSSECSLQQEIGKQKQLIQSIEQSYRILQQQIKDKQLDYTENAVRLADEIRVNQQLCQKISLLQEVKKELELSITSLTQQVLEKNALSSQYSLEIQNINDQLSSQTSSLLQAQQQISNLTINLQQSQKKLEQNENYIKQLEQISSQQKQCLIKQGKNKQKQLQKQLQEKEKEKNQLSYQLQRSQQRQRIITEEMSSKQGHQNDSLHLIKELQHKYQTQIDSKHQQIIILEQKISQYEANMQLTENQLSISNKQISKLKNEIEVQRTQSKTIQKNLEESLSNTEQRLRQEIEKVINEANNINNLKDQIAKMEEKLQESNKQLINIKSQKIRFEENAEEINKTNLNQIENLKLLTDKKNDEIISVKQQLQQSKAQIARTSLQIKEHLDHITILQQEIEATKQVISDLRQKQREQKDFAAALQQQNMDILNECRVLKTQLQQADIKLKALQQSMAKLRIKDEELEENIIILNAQIERYQQKQQQVIIQIASLKAIYEQKLSQNQKLNQSIELIMVQSQSREETLKIINQKYQAALLQLNLLERHKGEAEEQYKMNVEENMQLSKELKASKVQNDNFRQQVSNISNALKQKQEEHTIFINNIKEEYSNLQKTYQQFKALSILQNSQSEQKISKLIGQKQQLLNSFTIMESNIREQSVTIQKYEKQNAEKQAIINQKGQTINNMQIHNSHLLQKISQQQHQIEENKKQIELSQLTNNQILTTIATLRSELQRKVAQYQQYYQESQIQSKRIVEEKQAIIDNINKQLSSSQLAAETLRGQIDDLRQSVKDKEQRILLLEAQIQAKNEEIKLHLMMICDLQKKLAQQIEQKSQALQDKQFMSELYKDFQARQTQIGLQQKRLRQFQQDGLYFLNILHKQFSKQSINSIKNNHDLINIEIKRQQDESKATEDRLNQNIFKLNQEIIEQTNIATHFEAKLNEINIVKQNLLKDLQEKDRDLLKLKKEFKDKQLQILNEKNKLEQANQKLKIQVQQFKAKITKKETEVSKFSQNILEIEQKFNNTKRLLDDKEKQVVQKDNQLVQLKKQAQMFKNKMFEENKQKVEEKDYYERQLHKLRTEIQRMIVQNAQNAKKQLAAREEAVKSQKSALDKLHKEEIRKIKESIESYKKQKEDAEKQLSNAKNQLLQERKISAKITAKLNEVTTELAKLENLQLSSQQIQQKMLLKDDEIKKCFANIQSLKNTIMDLQQGIQTYQSMAEQKQREVEEQREKCVSLEIEMQKMKNDLQRNQRKLKDARMQKKVEQVINDKKDVIEKKQSSILPLKLLFLKYFQIGANYEAKLRAFNTLCQALSLNSKELQQMNQYKKTKLILQVPNSEKQKNQSLQNKFFNFLNSD